MLLRDLMIWLGAQYDKKNGTFRTSEINFIIAQIARHTGDLALIKKGLSSLFEPKSLSAEKEGFVTCYKSLIQRTFRLYNL